MLSTIVIWSWIFERARVPRQQFVNYSKYGTFEAFDERLICLTYCFAITDLHEIESLVRRVEALLFYTDDKIVEKPALTTAIAWDCDVAAAGFFSRRTAIRLLCRVCRSNRFQLGRCSVKGEAHVLAVAERMHCGAVVIRRRRFRNHSCLDWFDAKRRRRHRWNGRRRTGRRCDAAVGLLWTGHWTYGLFYILG